MAEDEHSEPASRAINKVSERLSLFLGGNYSADTLSQDKSKKSLHERLSARLATVESRRQSHIEAIVQAAYEAANEVSAGDAGTQASEDWLARFMDMAQDVADPDLQQVWGYILAQEITNPGCTSLQVLDALSGMVSSDIDLLEKVRRILLPTGYLLKLDGRNEFEDFGISENQIARLQDLGLVKPSDDLSVTFYAPTKGITFDYKGSDLIVRHPSSQLFILPAFQVTGTGMEIIPLMADSSVDLDYLKALGQTFKAGGYDYRIRDAMGALIEHV